MSAPGKVDVSFHFAELSNGMRLHYAQAGVGPTILFVHGFPEFWYGWRELLGRFGTDHRAVAPDMRGYNLSGKPPEVRDYRPRLLVEDLRLLLEHLQCRECVMVAHDWGGAVAWNFAAAHPQYLSHLVIVNAPHPVTFARELQHSQAQRQASAYMNLFRSAKAERVLSEDGFARLQRMTLDAWAANGGSATREDREAYCAAWSQPGALTGALNYYRASPLHPPEAGESVLQPDPDAFRVRVPTLVIWGERDEALLPGMLDGLDELVDSLRIVRIARGSHWVVHEAPRVVEALIRGFISGGDAHAVADTPLDGRG